MLPWLGYGEYLLLPYHNFEFTKAASDPSHLTSNLKLNSTFSKFINRQVRVRVTILVTTVTVAFENSGLKTKFNVNNLQTVTILPFTFRVEVHYGLNKKYILVWSLSLALRSSGNELSNASWQANSIKVHYLQNIGAEFSPKDWHVILAERRKIESFR